MQIEKPKGAITDVVSRALGAVLISDKAGLEGDVYARTSECN
jgi:hypothetical protein